MDEKAGKGGSMKKILWLLISIPALAQEPALLYHISYIEKRSGVVRELSARIKGDGIFLDKLQGDFPKDLKIKPPWYLKGLPPFQETIVIELEGLPPLTLRRKFETETEKSVLGEPLTKYRVHLDLSAKEEVIPLNDEEANQNDILRPYGIREVSLQGEGEVFSSEKKFAAAEQFVLSGVVIRGEAKENWHIEWAKAAEK